MRLFTIQSSQEIYGLRSWVKFDWSYFFFFIVLVIVSLRFYPIEGNGGIATFSLFNFLKYVIENII